MERLDHHALDAAEEVVAALGERRSGGDEEDPVVRALAQWVRAVDAEPARPHATATVIPLPPPGRARTRRRVRRVAAGLTLTVCALAGSTVAAALTGTRLPVISDMGAALVQVVRVDVPPEPEAVPAGVVEHRVGPLPGVTPTPTPTQVPATLLAPSREESTAGPTPDAAVPTVTVEVATVRTEPSPTVASGAQDAPAAPTVEAGPEPARPQLVEQVPVPAPGPATSPASVTPASPSPEHAGEQGPPEHAGQQGPPEHAGQQGPPEHAGQQGPPEHARP